MTVRSTFNMPHFETEAEEADWWYDNREEHGEIMAKAMEEGRTMTMKQVLEKHGLEPPLTPVSLDAQDVRRARKQADARGMDADVYIRGLLHEALMKSDAA